MDASTTTTTATGAAGTTSGGEESRSGGIKDFIAQTNMIGNVIAAAASQKNSYEPLPFADTSLFEETYKADVLRVNVNPQAARKHVFQPRVRIHVKVTAERKHGAHIFHPYVYTLGFTHGAQHKWEVIRSYKEIKETHKILAKLVKVDIGRSCSDLTEEEIKPEWPLFPTEHDHLVSATHIDERCKKLAEYLERMLTYPPFRDHPAVMALLGVSHLSFVDGLGPSLLEGPLQKRSGDNVYYGHLSQLKICCDKVKIFHDKRWFVLKDTYIVYTIPENNDTLGFVMLLDKMFECKMKIQAGAYHAIVIKNLQRSLVLKCKSAHQQREWYEKISAMMSAPVGRLFNDVTYLLNASYAPPRANQLTRWYVNAAQYMEHVMLGLMNAREEIFITDWWLCPELFLKRPSDDLQYRLDKILLKKAAEGVKIYVMLFKEVSFAIQLLSSRAKNILSQNGRNPNIKVQRHPEHSPAGVFLWSHHEKMVVIDQSVAFLGGVDLCFGRWDDDLHRLVDLGRRENKTEIEPNTSGNAIMSLANQINKFSLEAEMINGMKRMAGGESVETTEARGVTDPLGPQQTPETPPASTGGPISPTPIAAARSLSPTTPLSPPADSSAIAAAATPDDAGPGSGEQRRPDALIVAALMGNSIAKFNRTAKKTRLNSHVSAPAPTKLVHSPMSEPSPSLVNAASASPNATGTPAPAANTATTPNSHQKITAVLERFKSLQPSHHNRQNSPSPPPPPTQTDVISARVVGGGGGGSVNQNYQDTRSSNSPARHNSTNESTTTNNLQAQSSTTANAKKHSLNSTKLFAANSSSAHSRVTGSKASKLMDKFRTSKETSTTGGYAGDNELHIHQQQHPRRSMPRKETDVVKRDIFRNLNSKVTDLSVPTDPSRVDEDEDAEASKKEKVRRKWSRFKKSMKKKSQINNPLKRLRRRSNGSYEFDTDNSSDNSSEEDEAGENETYRYEENAELPVISNEGYYWLGKDYSNTYKADFKDIADFSRDQFDRTETPRMPWRDEALVVVGESARDLARHFIQRWNQCKREKVRQIQSYPFLLPKSYSEPFDYDYSWLKDQLFKCEVQMTRSLDSWSGGLCQTETSILNSYCDLINRAEHYIYIENQFFVTTTDPVKDYEVKNSIGRELVSRIVRAHKEGKKFRVYIVLPLLPGFENFNAIQAVQFYNLRSINLGEYSIYKTLKKEGVNDPSEYITFHGMRNWGVLMGKLVQEIIYVHSKLMIVDDKWVICGSANINDRSMLGKRDSEVAAVVKDQELFESTLNGQKVMVGKYANSLRKKIFKLHLGIYFNNPDKIEVQDCVSDEFYQYFRLTSHKNTVVYDEVFKCLPSDNILNFDDLTSYSERACLCKHDPYKGKQELEKNINGFVVDFPLKFLSQEKNFFPEINTPEGMVPTAMWT